MLIMYGDYCDLWCIIRLIFILFWLTTPNTNMSCLGPLCERERLLNNGGY